MLCLHHNDADGFASGYWVAKRFNDYNPDHFIMMDYGKQIDWWSKVKKDDYIIIVDFALEPDDMRKLLEITKNVIWIDHHITAIKKYEGFEEEIRGLRYDGIAASMLTYCYFFEMKDGKEEFSPNMCIKAPWFTKYIADYDVWKYEYGDETTNFMLGFETITDKQPYNKNFWESLDVSKVRELIRDGEICGRYRESLSSKAVEETGFEYEIAGIKTFCMDNNDAFSNSCWFGEKINEYDMICAFSYNGECWTYSLYCSDYAAEKKGINCGKIASEMKDKISGGGHMKAAGFQSKKFIFV